MTDIAALMDEIKRLGPSWKCDVSLQRRCSGEHWGVEVRDVWGHIHLPEFQGGDAVAVLTAARDYLRQFVETFDDKTMPWIDDEGDVRGDYKEGEHPASTGLVLVPPLTPKAPHQDVPATRPVGETGTIGGLPRTLPRER